MLLALHLLGAAEASAQFAYESTWFGGNGVWHSDTNWRPAQIPTNSRGLAFNVTIDAGYVMIEPGRRATVADVFLSDATLELQGTLVTGGMTLDQGYVYFGQGGLHVLGDLTMVSGYVDVYTSNPDVFRVDGDIVKSGYGGASLYRYNDTGQYNGDYGIVVQQGSFYAYEGALGSPVGGVTVGASEFARVELQAYRIADDIHLNNSHGYLRRGSLFGGGEWTGDLYLGDQGSSIAPNYAYLSGAIHGGELRLPSGVLEITSTGHDYTGRTVIGSVNAAELRLTGDGALTSPSGFDVHANSALRLVNFAPYFGTSSDRLPDSAPVTLLGGRLQFDFADSPNPVIESVGPLSIGGGYSTVASEVGQSWRFDGLRHVGHGAAHFNATGLGQAAAPIDFAKPPVLTNGIVGAWATAEANLAGGSFYDFASYEEGYGLLPLGPMDRPSSLATAGPDDHVLLTTTQPSLTAPAKVATLVQAGSTNLDLGGQQLWLTQGGLLAIDGGSIANGELTAGADGERADLYITSRYGYVYLNAEVTDNPGGGPVSLILSGGGGYSLGAANSHSGPTVRQGGSIEIYHRDAIPAGGDLILDNADAYLSFVNEEAPVRWGTVALHHNSTLYAPYGAVFEFDSLELDSGTPDVALTGDGALTKRTDGVAYLYRSSPNYSGDVTIEGGALYAYSTESLGVGKTTIRAGGTLVMSAPVDDYTRMLLNANINLDGGDLGVNYDYTGYNRWDVGGPVRVSGASRVLAFVAEGGNTYLPAQINLLRGMQLDSGAELAVLGDGQLAISQVLQVGEGTSLVLEGNSVAINAIQTPATGGSLEISGAGDVYFNVQMTNNASGPVTLTLGEDVVGHPSSGTMSLRRNSQMFLAGAVDGTLGLSSGALLGGNGSAGAVINASGVVAPGESIGTLTVGSLEQMPAGTLRMEVDGAAADLLIAQSVLLSGVVEVSLLAGGVVRGGDAFDLIYSKQLTLSGVQLLTHGLSGELSQSVVDSGPYQGWQRLQFTTTVPEPVAAWLLAILGAYGLAARRE